MKKNNVAQRPCSFNQPFVNSCIISNYAMQDNKILKTPTTPQFPMPDIIKPCINEVLQSDFENLHFNNDSFDGGSEDFPWTPDTPSSDSKDPLMTNAVNTDCSGFLIFPQKSISHGEKSISQSYHYNSQFSSIQFSSNEKLHMQTFKTYANDMSLSPSSELVICQKKNPNDLPFDIAAFSFSSNTSVQSLSNKRRPRLHLLQFIYCLLNSSKPTQCVCWVDKDDCIFRIINPNKLTNLWGRYKQNPNMSFDSLSRSLRLYYASGRLERVTGQRNQYRFVNREESIDFNRRNKRKSQQFTVENPSTNTSVLNLTATNPNQLTFIPKQTVIKNPKIYYNNAVTSHSILRQLI